MDLVVSQIPLQFRTAQLQKLSGVIDALSPASATPAGKSWLIKALHPSDPIPECMGVPDETSSPTVMLNYQMTSTITPPSTTNPWQFTFSLIPDPVLFASIFKSNSDGSSPSGLGVFNSQLNAAAQYDVKMAAFLAQGIYKWRLAYMSVSMYQDGPALADQGSMAAAQVVMDYRKVVPCTTSGAFPAQVCSAGLPVMKFDSSYQQLDFATLQAMPNAYFGQSKFGTYLPLHLDSHKWHGLHDLMLNGGTLTAADTASFIIPNQANAPTATWPYYGTAPAFIKTGSGAPSGTPVSHPCNDKWGHVSCVNLSPQSSFSFFIRAGFEAQVIPTSPLSSLQKISPKWDELALHSYAAIVREMKDAYPVEFNDLGELWNVIKGAAKVALPVLRQIPGVGGMIGTLGDALLSEPSLKQRKPHAPATAAPAVRSDAPPAAAVERVQDVAKAQTARLPQRRAKKSSKPAGSKRAGKPGRKGPSGFRETEW